METVLYRCTTICNQSYSMNLVLVHFDLFYYCYFYNKSKLLLLLIIVTFIIKVLLCSKISTIYLKSLYIESKVILRTAIISAIITATITITEIVFINKIMSKIMV